MDEWFSRMYETDIKGAPEHRAEEAAACDAAADPVQRSLGTPTHGAEASA
jgi:hypothetical protein